MFPPSHQKTPTLSALVCAAILIAVSARADSIPAHVAYVHDGDTVTVKTQAGYILHVRLAAIDAPELKQPFGIQSRDALCAMVCGKDVTVRTLKLDRYGRTVARIFLGDQDIGCAMLCAGDAWLYSQFLRQLAGPDRAPYLECAKNARDSHNGLWVDSNPAAPWDFRKHHPIWK